MLRYQIWLSRIQSSFYRTYFLPVQTFNITVSDLVIAHGSDSSVIGRSRNLISANKGIQGGLPLPNVGIGATKVVLETPLDGLHPLFQKGLDLLPVPHHTLVTHRHLPPQVTSNFSSTSCFQLNPADSQLQTRWGNCKRCSRYWGELLTVPTLGREGADWHHSLTPSRTRCRWEETPPQTLLQLSSLLAREVWGLSEKLKEKNTNVH